MKSVITACVILHNMIIEDELDVEGLEQNVNPLPEHAFTVLPFEEENSDPLAARRFLRTLADKPGHRRLQSDLVEHLWSLHGDDIND